MEFVCCDSHNVNTGVRINLIQINDYFWINKLIVKGKRQLQNKKSKMKELKKENREAKKEEMKENLERRKYFPQNFSTQWQNNVKEKLSMSRYCSIIQMDM
jgi:uncharacterized membrane protein (DUF106 family)